MSLSYDWDEVFSWIGHDEGYDYSPAGALGYLPRCLNSPLVMVMMTHYRAVDPPPWISLRSSAATRGDHHIAASHLLHHPSRQHKGKFLIQFGKPAHSVPRLAAGETHHCSPVPTNGARSRPRIRVHPEATAATKYPCR